MSNKEPIGWYTRGGKHIPIFDESDRIQKEEDDKNRQMEASRKQAEKLSKKNPNIEIDRSAMDDNFFKQSWVKKQVDRTIDFLNKNYSDLTSKNDDYFWNYLADSYPGSLWDDDSIKFMGHDKDKILLASFRYFNKKISVKFGWDYTYDFSDDQLEDWGIK